MPRPKRVDPARAARHAKRHTTAGYWMTIATFDIDYRVLEWGRGAALQQFINRIRRERAPGDDRPIRRWQVGRTILVQRLEHD